MSIRNYQPKQHPNIDYFNKLNHPNVKLSTLDQIFQFLKDNDYHVIKNEECLIIPKGSPNGCKSFIDYKAPLFDKVTMSYDDSELNNAFVKIIKQNP